MAVILCATRGGEESLSTQDKAIQMAKESGDSLLFLYVVNLHFLDKTAAPIVVDIEDEISDMGDFLLLMAKERAAAQGVEARTILRKGRVRDEIIKTVLEENVSLVLLGCPSGERSAFQLADLQKFAAEIKAKTGAKMECVSN